MKKRALSVLGMVVLVSGSMLFGGCTKADKTVENEPVEKKEEKQEVQEEVLALIGTEAEGEGIYKVILENKTGKEIVGVSVKDSSMSDYPGNMLPEGEVFTIDERRYLYYDSTTSDQTEDVRPEAGAEDEKLLEMQMDVQLTFADATMLVLTAFPFGDIEEGQVCLEDDVAFIQYKSLSTEEALSTKEAELAIKAAAEEAQRQAEEAAAAEAQRQAEEAAEAQRQAEAAAEAQRQAETAAAAQRQQQQKKQQAQQQQPSQQAPDNSDDGCVNDGLVY